MAVPLWTTTFTVLRLKVLVDAAVRDPDGEGYGTSTDGPGPLNPAAYEVILTGVRGAIAAPGGSERSVGGSQESVTMAINLDPGDIRHDDDLVDDQTGARYRIVWITARSGVGMDHLKGAVRTVKGAAP